MSKRIEPLDLLEMALKNGQDIPFLSSDLKEFQDWLNELADAVNQLAEHRHDYTCHYTPDGCGAMKHTQALCGRCRSRIKSEAKIEAWEQAMYNTTDWGNDVALISVDELDDLIQAERAKLEKSDE